MIPYATLRALALSGAPTQRVDCEDAEHACGFCAIALLHLLCARALWSAWRHRFDVRTS